MEGSGFSLTVLTALKVSYDFPLHHAFRNRVFSGELVATSGKSQYSQPDAPDPVLQPVIVLDLVRSHVPGALAMTAVDESGGEARTYAVDGGAGVGGLILKTQRPHRLRAKTSLERETFFLRHLESSFRETPLPVPHVFGYGKRATAQGPVEYICMSRIHGVAMRHVKLDGESRAALLKKLGGVLRRIHQVDQAPLVNSGLFPGDHSRADLILRLERGLKSALEDLKEAGVSWPGRHPLTRVVSSALPALPKEEPDLVALHSNPGETHTFADPAKRIFTGLIDFGDAWLGHPAFDLMRWGKPEERADLLDGYLAAGESGKKDAFLATWRVVSILVGLQEAAWDQANLVQTASRIDQLVDLLGARS
jgi:aminoglycoside phosphotransferase (APT) family kinase protein